MRLPFYFACRLAHTFFLYPFPPPTLQSDAFYAVFTLSKIQSFRFFASDLRQTRPEHKLAGHYGYQGALKIKGGHRKKAARGGQRKECPPQSAHRKAPSARRQRQKIQKHISVGEKTVSKSCPQPFLKNVGVQTQMERYQHEAPGGGAVVERPAW